MSKPRKRDPAKLLTELRRKSAGLIGLDPDKLSAADAALVARIGTLRLLLDDLESAQLRGEAIDAGRYCATSEAYEALLRHKSATAVDVHGVSVTLEAARRKMAAILGLVVDDDGDVGELPVSPEHARIAELEAEVRALREQLAAQAAQPMPTRPSPSLPPDGNVVPLSETPEQRQARLDANNARPPPEHYLQPPTAVWRNYVGADGVMTPGRRMQPSDWEPKW